jgi:hypothetical protein
MITEVNKMAYETTYEELVTEAENLVKQIEDITTRGERLFDKFTNFAGATVGASHLTRMISAGLSTSPLTGK